VSSLQFIRLQSFPVSDRSDILPPSFGRLSTGSSHNNLRISRILKCLSELGLERLNAGFLLHVLSEQSEANELNSRGIRGSMDRWWANCLRNEEERSWIGGLIRRVREEDFLFTREDYEQGLERRAQTGQLGIQEGAVTPGDQEETVIPGDQGATVTPGDQEETVIPGDQEETVAPRDEQETVTPRDEQDTVTPGHTTLAEEAGEGTHHE